MIRSREIAGWLLVALGLGTFGLTFYLLIAYTMIVQAGPMVAVGFIVFRGGIHLLKVAIAARICQPNIEVRKPAVRSVRTLMGKHKA